MKSKAFLFNAILVLVSFSIGALFSEAAYRAYLYLTEKDKFMLALNPERPTFGLYDVSHWEYDEEFGFIYPPGRDIHLTFISAGRVAGCQILDTINERGNIGEIRGDYDSAEVKILVFGDSFPAFHMEGWTFPAKLQDTLSERLDQTVHVVNFGRDGTGVLQIFSHAAAKIPEWKPDLAVITFTTDDLDRMRIWRTVTEKNGEERVLTTIDPNPDPDIGRAQDTFVIDRRANAAWCKETMAKGEAGFGDPLMQELAFKYRRMAREAGYWMPHPMTLSHSYVLARVIHGDPYHRKRETFTIPRYMVEDYALDPRFVEDVKRIQESGIPFIIVHLPLSTEIEQSKEADLFPHRQKQWDSLERATGKPILGVTDHIPMPLEDPRRMDASPTNLHPSPFGMQIYADAITEMIVRGGHLDGAGGAQVQQ